MLAHAKKKQRVASRSNHKKAKKKGLVKQLIHKIWPSLTVWRSTSVPTSGPLSGSLHSVEGTRFCPPSFPSLFPWPPSSIVRQQPLSRPRNVAETVAFATLWWHGTAFVVFSFCRMFLPNRFDLLQRSTPIGYAQCKSTFKSLLSPVSNAYVKTLCIILN